MKIAAQKAAAKRILIHSVRFIAFNPVSRPRQQSLDRESMISPQLPNPARSAGSWKLNAGS